MLETKKIYKLPFNQLLGLAMRLMRTNSPVGGMIVTFICKK
jgi:hypothetical protein